MEGQENNVIAIAACGNQSMALRKNGTVTNWGHTFGTIPTDLTHAIAIAAGTNFCLALRSNGNVVAWGNNANGQTDVPVSATNVVAIAAGDHYALALREDGTVVAWGANGSGQANVPAGLSNVMAIAAGRVHSAALKNDGTVVAWGDNSYEQTEVGGGLKGIKLLAAGGDHTLASAFSPLVQYQVNVSKDLLLVYNSSSTDSIWVKDYYVAHRPLVSGASVLGISCPGTETIYPADYTNTIQAGVLGWLTSNPTLRPQYVVLFLDIPSRVNGFSTNEYSSQQIKASVSSQLHTNFAGWRPFVTHINMRDTNACAAYINKLASIGGNNSPGQVILSASHGGYGNTNYYFDDNRNFLLYGTGPHAEAGGAATNGILATNPGALVVYVPDMNTPNILGGTNVAGYLSWGRHSPGLGPDYATNATGVKFTGSSGWYVIETIESANGQRYTTDHGTFSKWYAPTAFGGTNYAHKPVGAVTHVDEPSGFWNDPAKYFGLWERGRTFGVCAWESRRTERFQAVGDPLIKR